MSTVAEEPRLAGTEDRVTDATGTDAVIVAREGAVVRLTLNRR